MHYVSGWPNRFGAYAPFSTVDGRVISSTTQLANTIVSDSGTDLAAKWPSYLIHNITGQRHYPTVTNDFHPSSVIFAPHQRTQILLSDIGVQLSFSVLGVLVYWSTVRGLRRWRASTACPTSGLTTLQHIHPHLPHYRSALSTVDRVLSPPRRPHPRHLRDARVRVGREGSVQSRRSDGHPPASSAPQHPGHYGHVRVRKPRAVTAQDAIRCAASTVD